MVSHPTALDVHVERLGPLVPVLSASPSQRIAVDGMLLRALVGSTVHGTNVGGQDDRDEMGICVESPETVIGSHTFKHYEYRTQPQGTCSGPGDLDLIVYSLRRYCYLASTGNATVILPLFVPKTAVCFINEFGHELRARRHWFVSQQCGHRFLGYMRSQRQDLLGLRSSGSRNQGRAGLRARYGFDVKSAMHMVRLGLQGLELMRTGEMSVPVGDRDLTWLQELRRGERSKEEALARAETLEREIGEALRTTRLPEYPDRVSIDAWLGSVHRRHWGW